MWDDALRRAAAIGPAEMQGSIVDEADGLANLLSQHADQVMASAAPDQRSKRIVETIFRALTDVTSEGAAIRRPCGFGKLCAVAGVPPSEVRPILDAYRAPGVSFLTPYTPQPIDEKTPIDISHEALIRCWREIGPGANAWLLREFRDGVAWRTLMLQAQNFAEGSNFLSEAASEARAAWLAERNEAWSQRYGGEWPKVVALVEVSQQHWRGQREAARARRIRRLATALGVAAVLAGAGAIWVARERTQQQERLQQEDIDKSAMQTAKTLLEGVLHAYDTKSLDLAGAEGLASISGLFLEKVRASQKTSAADLLWAQTLNVDSTFKRRWTRIRKRSQRRAGRKLSPCRSLRPIRTRCSPCRCCTTQLSVQVTR